VTTRRRRQHPNSQPLQVSPEAIRPRLMECGGKRSATPLFFCENVSAREKRRRRFALPAQSKMRLAPHQSKLGPLFSSPVVRSPSLPLLTDNF